MKMKVKVEDLKRAIEKHVADDEKRFEKETGAYEKGMALARKRHIQNVEVYLSDLVKGGDTKDSYDLRNYLDRGVKWPSKPRQVQHYDSILAKLALSVQPVVTVDDRSEYMRILSDKCICS